MPITRTELERFHLAGQTYKRLHGEAVKQQSPTSRSTRWVS